AGFQDRCFQPLSHPSTSFRLAEQGLSRCCSSGPDRRFVGVRWHGTCASGTWRLGWCAIPTGSFMISRRLFLARSAAFASAPYSAKSRPSQEAHARAIHEQLLCLDTHLDTPLSFA